MAESNKGKSIKELLKPYISSRPLYSDLPNAYLPTGHHALDIVLHGGWPVGRVIEVVGEESVGKSLIGYHAIKEATSRGYRAVLIDTEGTFYGQGDPDFWVRNLGIDENQLAVVSTDEQITVTLELVEKILRRTAELSSFDEPVLVVWDSVATTPLEGELKDNVAIGLGARARFMSSFIARWNQFFRSHGLTILLINQLRGQVSSDPFDSTRFYQTYLHNRESTTGRAIKFWADVRLNVILRTLTREDTPSGDKRVIGVKIICDLMKSRISPPFRRVKCDIYTAPNKTGIFGIDPMSGFLDFVIDSGIVIKKGSWFEFEGNNYRKTDLMKVMETRIDEIKAKVLEYFVKGDSVSEGEDGNGEDGA